MSFIIEKISSFLQDENTVEFLEKEKFKQNKKHCFSFKLFDDDGVEYFNGLSSKKWDFEPLDEFGLAYGCTEIKYWNENKYMTT